MSAYFQKMKISELADVVTGGTPSTSKPEYWGGEIQWMSSGEVNNKHIYKTKKHITELGASNSNARILPYDSVMIALAGQGKTRGMAAILKTSTACNQSLAAILPNNNYDSNFLYHYLDSKYKEIRALSGGEGRSGLNLKMVNDIEIMLPDMQSQRKIAGILDKVDDLIITTQQIIDQTEQLKRGLMMQLFDITWPKLPLSEVAIIQTGIAKNGNLRGDDIVEMPYLRVANVLDGRLDLSEIKHIKIRKGDISRYLLRKGDLLLTEGGDRDKLGRGFLWRGEINDCLHQNHVFAVRSDETRLNPTYLAYLTQSPYGKKYFLAAASQTTNLASINSTKLKNFPVLLPLPEKQLEVSDMLSAMDKKIAINRKLKAKQQELRKGLLQSLLTGRVRP